MHRLPPNFIYALNICRKRFLSQFWSSRLIGRSEFWRYTLAYHVAMGTIFTCETAHTLETATFFTAVQEPYVVWKLSVKAAQICTFGRIGRKTKRVRLSKLLGRELRKYSLDEREACTHRWNVIFSLTQLQDPYSDAKVSISWAKICKISSLGREKRLMALKGQIWTKIFLARKAYRTG